MLRNRHRVLLRTAYVLSLGFIAVATLRPSSGGVLVGWSLCVRCPDGGIAGIIQNVLLFVPLGFTLGLSRLSLPVAVLAGFATTVSVETAQLLIPGRDPNVGDLLFNISGTGVGWLLARAARAAALAPPAQRARIAAAGATATVLALATVAYLFQPAATREPFRAQRLEPGAGGIASATVGSIPLEAGRLAPAAAQALAAGVTVHVRTVITPPDSNPWWIRVRDAAGRQVVSLRKERDDVVVRYTTRAETMHLDHLEEWRAPGALGGRRPGDTVDVALTRAGVRFCVIVDDTARCGFGPTLGAGWTFIELPGALPRWLSVGLDALWMALLFVPVGLCVRRERVALAAAAAAVAALWVLPAIAGLEAPRLHEIAGAFGGIGLVLAVRSTSHATRRREHVVVERRRILR